MGDSLQAGAGFADLVTVDFFGFVIDPQPVEKIFPAGADTADFAFKSVRKNTDSRGVEQLGDLFFVSCQIIIVGVFEFLIGVFKFDEDEGQTVDIKQDVRPAIVNISPDPKLGDGQEVVVFWLVEIDEPDASVFGFTLGIAEGDGDAVADEAV